jgi:hypothetical protein
MLLALLIVGLGIVLLFALARFTTEKVEDRRTIAERWKNPNIRRWWIANGLFFVVAFPLILFLDSISEDGEPGFSWIVVVAAIFFRAVRPFFGIDKESRPSELGPEPKPFEGLRARTRQGFREQRDLQGRPISAPSSNRMILVYVVLGLLLLIALVSPDFSG